MPFQSLALVLQRQRGPTLCIRNKGCCRCWQDRSGTLALSPRGKTAFTVKLQSTHLPFVLTGMYFNSFWVWKNRQGVNCQLTLYWMSTFGKMHRAVLSCPRTADQQQENSDDSDSFWIKFECRISWVQRVWTQITVASSEHPHTPHALTWSYSEAPGYRGQPRNSSAITQPSDHMSIASQNGKPRMISGALLKTKGRGGKRGLKFSENTAL